MNVYQIIDTENRTDAFNGVNEKDVAIQYKEYFPDRTIKEIKFFHPISK